MAPMLRPLFARTLAALGLAALLSTPLSAQLDPRLQKDPTDFLNLYQQTNSQTLKPEIVTIFDFTGSMDSIMFHPNFPNADLTDSDGGANMKFSVTYTGGAYVCTASLYINGSTLTAKSNSATNPLIRPDGSVLTAANIDANYVASSPALPGETASPKSSDVRNWVRSLSHVRFTKNGRTLDIPVPWTILDDSSITPGTNEYRKQYMGYPLKMTILDPNTGTAPGTEYEMDTRYRIPSNTLVSSSGTVPLSSYTMTGVVYRNAYFNWLFSSASAPYVPDASTTAGVAFKNGIPSRTRASAVKDAAMRTWAKYHGQVYWAYRFIHDITDNVSQENTHGTTVYNDSRTNMPSGDPRSSFVYGGAQRGWYLLNSNSLTGLQRLAAYQSGGNTPMTYAVGNTLAQLNDPNNVFNDVETGTDKPVDCMKHFLILFTDGFPNTDGGGENTNTPYLTGTSGTTFDANTGNGVIKGNPSLMNPNSTDWNPMNLAAVAAHLGGGRPDITNFIDPTGVTYPAAGTYPSGGGTSVANWLPFYIKSRGSGTNFTTFTKPHPIYTMTVGLSMAGSASNPNSPKYRLLLAAAFGDPDRVHADDITQLKPFTLTNPSDPNSKDPNSVFFFDAANPQTLVDNLDAAFYSTVALSSNNATSKPTVPFVGLGLASQIYLGNFQIPLNGGAVWSGDLLMFPTKQVNGQTMILDQTGAIASKIDYSTATWTAADALYARGWANRKVFTRLPATTSVPNPPLVPFAYRPTSGSTSAFDAIKAYVGPSTMNDDAKNKLIEFVLGADTGSTATPYPSRIAHPPLKTDTLGIMGDVIDSAPSAVEYTLTPAVTSQLPTTLATAATNPGARFRVIFVGTNTGMLHAFGEISWIDTTDPLNPITKGVADELWAFVPTDLLSHLDYLQGINPHRFMVDGSPYVYHLDLAPTGSMLPNGTVDSNETARVIFGLRKGGRSYYALDIHDPFNPAMAWALSPDEVTANPGILDGRIESSNPALVKTLVQNMGFSSANLAVGRVAYGSPAVHLRDALFLGGGFSTPQVDAAFSSTTKLGRSALAVDAASGNILQAWDFINDGNLSGIASGMGPVGAGVVPFEYFLNSGLVQRAYFTDFNGNLWALGSGANTKASDNNYYRRDTSSLDAWTQDGTVGGKLSLRKVYAGTTNDFITTLPAPFLTGNVPTTAGAIPVGIALASGNRDNPLDYNPPASLTQHEVSVLFDNQDASLGATAITPSDLYVVPDSAPGVTPSEVIPGNAAFYLANGKRGYVIRFPAKSGGYIPKGINEPMVLGGAMFFSYFTPTESDPCTGGGGITSSNRICDVLYPTYQGNATTVSNSYNGPCVGGHMFAWSGVATNFSARSTVSVNQAGVVSTGGTGAPGTSQVQIQTIFGQVKDRLPRPRTWRTVR